MSAQAPDTGPTAADDELAARAMAATRDPVLHVVSVALRGAHTVGGQVVRIIRQSRRRRGQ